MTALELVRGVPFGDLLVAWATPDQSAMVGMLQDAALTVAATCRDLGEWDHAREAIDRGLLLHDPNEELYLEWGRIEVARRRPAEARRVAQLLERRLHEDADEIAGAVGYPSAQTQLQFQQLLGGT